MAAVLGRHAPALAALIAAAAALPGLCLPYLSDDWANLAAVAEGVPSRTPFGYFRPLYAATLRAEWLAFGLAPMLSHIVNVLLVAGTAGLVVIAVRRATGDATLAGLTGFLFAIHPYHVENAAWVCARADPLYGLFFVGAILAYERWRVTGRGLPIAAMLLFEAALLAKEAAVSLPLVLWILARFDRKATLGPTRWLRGLAPMVAVAIVHFSLVRPWGLGKSGLEPLAWMGLASLRRLALFATAAVVPAHIERIEVSPSFWGALVVAGVALGILLALARAGSGKIPRAFWPASGAFVALLLPSLISFQERFFFLPSAASALALAALLRAAAPRLALLALGVLSSAWMVALADHWLSWREAGRASAALVQGLVEASYRPGVREIVVANLPHRIRGAPVTGDLSAAVGLSGGRRVRVLAATRVDYPTASRDGLEGPPVVALGEALPFVEVSLFAPGGVFSRIVLPAPPPAGGSVRTEHASVTFEGSRRARVRVTPAPDRSRAAYVWKEGRLVALF